MRGAILDAQLLEDIQPGGEAVRPPPRGVSEDEAFYERYLHPLESRMLRSVWRVAGYRPWEWLLHWPAWLVVAGCALALTLYLGRTRREESLTLGLACAGVVGGLFGLTQALQGFASESISAIAGGLTFMVAACYAALLGLAAFAMPGQDRALRSGKGARSLATSRLAWYGFPFVALVLFAIVLVLVMVPIKKHATAAPEDRETTSLIEPVGSAAFDLATIAAAAPPPSGEDDPLELGAVA